MSPTLDPAVKRIVCRCHVPFVLKEHGGNHRKHVSISRKMWPWRDTTVSDWSVLRRREISKGSGKVSVTIGGRAACKVPRVSPVRTLVCIGSIILSCSTVLSFSHVIGAPRWCPIPLQDTSRWRLVTPFTDPHITKAYTWYVCTAAGTSGEC